MDTLFINACVREGSRTERLARVLLSRLPGTCEEIRLADAGLIPLDGEALLFRDRCIEARDFDDAMFAPARQLKAAKRIVIAAPYWDLSFPSLLKVYVEQVLVNGLTFCYSDEGMPVGLCAARKLYYVSTAGGPVWGENGGFSYIRSVAGAFWGVKEFSLIHAEGLDIFGNDAEAILAAKQREIAEMAL